jgi:Beta-lactamase
MVISSAARSPSSSPARGRSREAALAPQAFRAGHRMAGRRSSSNAVSSGRLETPSLAKIAFMWSLRVYREMNSARAISAAGRPRSHQGAGGQQPNWPPGTAHGCHSMTYGFLVGELIRRVTGKLPGPWTAEHISGPLGADCHLGLPAGPHGTIAPVLPHRGKADGRPRLLRHRRPGRVPRLGAARSRARLRLPAQPAPGRQPRPARPGPDRRHPVIMAGAIIAQPVIR